MLHLNRRTAARGIGEAERSRILVTLSNAFIRKSYEVAARRLLGEAQSALLERNASDLLAGWNAMVGDSSKLSMGHGPTFQRFELPPLSGKDKAILECYVSALETRS